MTTYKNMFPEICGIDVTVLTTVHIQLEAPQVKVSKVN